MAIHKHVTNLSGLNNKHDGDDWAASENNLLVNGVIELQNIVDDLVEDESDADEYVEEAPFTGDDYVRNNGQWVAFTSSGVLQIVDVESGTSAITAELGKYYNVAGTTASLAITLPSVSSSERGVKGCVFSIVTGSSPNVAIGSANSSHISYPKGYKIEANTAYEINCIFNGIKWAVSYIEFEDESD